MKLRSLVILLTLGFACSHAADDDARDSEPSADTVEITKDQLRTYMRYDSEITLDADQQAVRRDVLAKIPAPCCSSYTAETCCCACNLSRALWGFTKHLITEKGLGPSQLDREVRDWLAKLRPTGFSGDACFKGRCGDSIRDGACGGMNPENLNF